VQITRAVITAAGRGVRQYPASDTVQKAMLPVVDRDGLTKPVLQIIAEQALESGIEEICVVSAPGDEAVYRDHFRNYAANLRSAFKGVEWAEEQARRLFDLEQRLRFSVQPEPQGYGHAVWCAREFVAGEPFLLLLGDHLYLSAEPRRCARQLIDLALAENCAVSAVQATREHLIHQYGTLTGRGLAERSDVYTIDEIIEKPNPTLAELRLQVPGLCAGHYLCFFGMHVLTPTVFDLLDQLVRDNTREHGQIQLTTALSALARREKYLAIETRGSRFNLGVKFGVVEAQIALAMAGGDRERILAVLDESLTRLEQNSSRRSDPTASGPLDVPPSLLIMTMASTGRTLLDLSHSAWSDIFFLGMDYPEGARVLNISVDLGVHGRDLRPNPPIECRVRVIAKPLLRLTSIDLNTCKDVDSLEELFNFGNDYLGLVKAGVIASGLVPPSLEGTTVKLSDLLARVVRPGHGLEVVSKVNDIPKGSRLAVSTNLLASLIAILMRADRTGPQPHRAARSGRGAGGRGAGHPGLTSLPDLPCAFLAVPRLRGQQLKDAAQLDGWVTDGSRDHVESLCAFPR